jgi:Zn-dependent peptidase ImmA (M78 family)
MGTNYSTSNNLDSKVTAASMDQAQATDLIIEHTRQLVNQCIKHRGHDEPPFLPEEFAHLQGIKRIEKADLKETDAVLFRFHDGYVIKVNQNHNLARQNFSCAHEIGHTLFSELKLDRYIKNIEYRTFNPPHHAELRAKVRERLCDVAATELLMPESVFRKYLLGFGTSIHSIERLANIFRVSIRAAAWRIAEVSEEPCIFLMWKPWLRNKSKGLRLALCVGPGRQTNVKSHYIPLHTYVRPPSALHQAYGNDRAIKSFKHFKIYNDVKRCPMESKGFGLGETRYVVSLAFPGR